MKISFLIPTKNRLSLLRQTVASILDQDDDDIEIVISDNASAEDYGSYIDSLSDKRIVYFRQTHPVSVTENWQKALALASGDYVLMLGDDDAPAPDFMVRIRALLSSDEPDLVYLAGYHYCYPNVLAAAPAGYLHAVTDAEFLPGKSKPFELDTSYAHELAESVVRFQLRFGMNAQHFLLKASFARLFERVGGLYQSPYPDTFAAIAALTHAKSISVIPKEVVIIGISPKSFGAYYFSGRYKEGYEFLDNANVDMTVRDALRDAILPGDPNNTNWLIAVASARAALGGVVKSEVGVARYRALQILNALSESHLHGNREPIDAIRNRLSESERLLVEMFEASIDAFSQDPHSLRNGFAAMRNQMRQFIRSGRRTVDIGAHSSISDAYAWLKRHGDQPVKAAGAKPVEATPTAKKTISKPPRSKRRSRGRIPFRSVFRTAALSIPPIRRLYNSTIKSAQRIEALEAENRALRQQVHQKTRQGPVGPLTIAIHRNSEVIRVAPAAFDEIQLRSGDSLEIEPPSEAAKLLSTPDGHHHIQIGPDLGLRIPAKVNFVSFRGFSVPEHLLALTGAGFASFDEIGKAHIANYAKYMGLDPAMTFLEIGSGIGRDAFQLLDIIGPDGRYLGIDVQRESILWCQQNITLRHPNFQFVHFNAYHELHNPLSTKTTMDFPIPVPDHSVDRVAAGSVLTHIFREEITYYMKEIARVLKPGGLAYLTFFLYTEEAVAASRRKSVTPYNLRFEHLYAPGCYINDPTYPTGAVAYTAEAMQQMIDESGLRLARPFIRGQWSGLFPDSDDGQDVALLTV